MRFTHCIVLSTAPLIALLSGDGQRACAADGNRVVGLVDREDTRTPFESGRVRVEVSGRGDLCDKAISEDGLFYLIIPKNINVFRLQYIAEGYWPVLSDEIKNERDPERRRKVSLQKIDPKNDAKNRKRLDGLITVSLKLAKESPDETKQVLRANLVELAKGLKAEKAEPELLKYVEKALHSLK